MPERLLGVVMVMVMGAWVLSELAVWTVRGVGRMSGTVALKVLDAWAVRFHLPAAMTLAVLYPMVMMWVVLVRWPVSMEGERPLQAWTVQGPSAALPGTKAGSETSASTGLAPEQGAAGAAVFEVATEVGLELPAVVVALRS